MKHAAISLAVLLTLALAVTISVTGASSEVDESELVLKVEKKNPWTHLDLNRSEEQFQFAIVTDRTGGRRPGVFTRAVEKVNLLQPEFVLSVGDLIEGYTKDPGQWALEWAEFEGKVDDLQMPFFFCPGNHDISNLPMSEEWHRKFGRGYYHFLYKDVLFLVLNSEDPPSTKERPYQFSREQQEWAIDVLKNNRNVRWTFVLMHKPTWTYDGKDPAELGWAAIEDALQGRNYTVFSGHKHNYAKFNRKGQEYYMLATTGGVSKLSGLENGQFDHFVWVTMKKDGPVIANMLLDGVEDEDVRVLSDRPER